MGVKHRVHDSGDAFARGLLFPPDSNSGRNPIARTGGVSQPNFLLAIGFFTRTIGARDGESLSLFGGRGIPLNFTAALTRRLRDRTAKKPREFPIPARS